MKRNGNQTGQVGAYSTGWNAWRSLNLLKFRLKQPATLPDVNDDTDEEMENEEEETVDEGTDVNVEDEALKPVDEGKNNITDCGFTERKSKIELPNSDSCGHCTQGEYIPSIIENLPNENGAAHNHCTVPTDALPVPRCFRLPDVSSRLSCSRKSYFTSTEHLAAALHCGLDVIGSLRHSAALGRSSFRFFCVPAGAKAVIPVVEVDAGVQTLFSEDESSEKDSAGSEREDSLSKIPSDKIPSEAKVE